MSLLPRARRHSSFAAMTLLWWAWLLLAARPVHARDAGEPAVGPDIGGGLVTPDYHGAWPAVGSGDARDPFLVWSASRDSDPKIAVGGVVDFAADPLEVSPDLDDTDTVPLLKSTWAAAASARWSPVRRFALDFTFPLVGGRYATENVRQYGYGEAGTRGVAIGDLRLAVPIGILAPEEGLALSAIPFATVSPQAKLFLASGRPTGGLVLTMGWRGSRVSGDLAGAVTLARALETELGTPLRGWATGTYGASLVARAGRSLWVGAELRGTGNLAPAYARPGLWSSELLLAVRGGFGRSSVGGAAGAGVRGGPGAAARRLVIGGTWAPGQGAQPEDEAALSWVFQVSDPDGVPVADAEITAGGRVVGATNGAGEATVPRSGFRWVEGVMVRAERLVPQGVERPDDPEQPIRVSLGWRPAMLDAKVTLATGEPVPVELVAVNTARPDAAPIRGPPGELMLPPGTYEIRIVPSDPALSPQVRRVVVRSNGAPPAPLEVVALPSSGGDGLVALQIVDPERGPIAGARILVDGLPVGTTGDEGFVGVGGLQPGQHEVQVQHESFTGAVIVVEVDASGAVREIPLQRQPGTVRVVARTVDGAPVPDAVVRFVGVNPPTRLPPMALGSNAERIQVLSPGEWVAVVSSPAQGVQERGVLVPADRYELITVDVVFQPIEDGVADLDLRVVDAGGAPIEGAQVRLDGSLVGATSTGGALVLRKLAVGPRRLTIEGPDLATVDRSIVLASGVQERVETVRYAPGVVDVVVRGPDGPVQDALVRFVGGVGGPKPTPVPTTGRLRSRLPPGAWTVVVSSAAYGVQERDLALPPDDGLLHTVELVLASFEAGAAQLTVEVVDPRGRPVGDTALALNGVRVGTAGNTGIVRLPSLEAGPVTLRVDPRGALAGLQRTVTLAPGDNRVRLALPWAPNVAEIRVSHDGEPVRDAVVRLLADGVRARPEVVDLDGQVVLPVHKGLWAAYVTSAAFGVAEQQFEVVQPVTRVDVTLVPPGAERADLAVAVVDPDGLPVGDAVVLMDGAKLGDTEVSGVAVGRSLEPKSVKVEVRAPDFVAWGPAEVTLAPGGSARMKVELEWLETEVSVLVTGPDGQPVDATVRWRGKRDVPGEQTGPDGALTTRLTPGNWRVYATAGALAADRELEVHVADVLAPIALALVPTGATMSGESVRITEMVQFDFDRATLRSDSAPILAQVAKLLLSQPDIVRVEVQGHTDTVGTIEVNMRLSQARAEAVVAALVALGVPPETIFPRGYGPTVPLGDNATDPGRAQNRRVQFEILERAAR